MKDMAKNRFYARVQELQQERDSLLCVGLDPDVSRFPASLPKTAEGILPFCKATIDATQDLVCCYKPQFAHFASQGAEAALAAVIKYAQGKGVPVLLDAKRGDVASTARQYATEIFDRYNADAVTVSPYLGQDALQPFLEQADKGVFILCRTSNKGGADLQHLPLANGRLLYEQVAELAATQWNGNGNVGLVVGATRPEELARIRTLCPDLPLLLPGVGAQGADVAAMLQAGQGGPMIVSSSRAILHAGQGQDFADQARQAALSLLAQLRPQ